MGIGRKGRGRGRRRHGREAVGGGGGHDWGLDWSGGGGGACVSLAVVLVRKVGGGWRRVCGQKWAVEGGDTEHSLWVFEKGGKGTARGGCWGEVRVEGVG